MRLKRFAAFAAALFLPFASVLAQNCLAPPAGLVAWWRGEGDANDYASTNGGVLLNGGTANTPGYRGLAFHFDGTNGFAQFVDNDNFKPDTLTIAAWVKFDSLDSDGTDVVGEQYIVFKQNSVTLFAPPFDGFNLRKTRRSGIDRFVFSVASAGGATAEALGTSTVTSNTWYFIAGVRTTNSIQIFVNGALQKTTSVSFAQDYGMFPLMFGSSGQFYMDRKLAGYLDEVALFNRALSTAEILAIYNAGTNGMCERPRITSQPQWQTVLVGSNATFNVAAAGATPMKYNWQRNGSNLVDGLGISGSTNATLTLSNLQVTDDANFTVVLSNISGVVTSSVAALNVETSFTNPQITTPPASQTVRAGTNITMQVAATGTGPLLYQWLFNGVPMTNGMQIAGADTPALAINFALAMNSGDYSVIITNISGAVTSTVATLTVTNLPPPPAGVVGWWPGDGSANDIVGTNHGSLQGTAIANFPGFNGNCFSLDGSNGYVRIPDALTQHLPALTVEVWVRFREYQSPGTSAYPNQQYIVFKQNSQNFEFEGFGMTKDHDQQGDVILWEVASAQGTLIRIDTVSTVVTGQWFHVVGVRGPDFSQVYLNGKLEAQTNVNFPQDYGTNPMYFGTSGQPSYDRRLQGELDEVTLYNRVLTSNEICGLYLAGAAGKQKAPVLQSQPQSLTKYWGENASFSSGATGAVPLGYRWQKYGAPITGATNTSLSFTNLQLTNAGSYTFVATNAYGTATSDGAVLTIKVADVWMVPPTGGAPYVAGLNITALTNKTYGIQYASGLNVSNTWIGLTNITLTTNNTRTWFDPAPAVFPQRYYRVVPGPISVP
jgi:hypothetical protein